MSNDLMTNIKKYGEKLVNLVWSKIEEYIPFKKEITELYMKFEEAYESFLTTDVVVQAKKKVSCFIKAQFLVSSGARDKLKE
jgi:hypothetical protein